MPGLGTTEQQGLNTVDDDFQARYVAAEQAYGAGNFEAAKAITSTLLAELDPLPDGVEERDAVLAWRSFVALLAGHIHLYGLEQSDQAREHYALVLARNPPNTLQELAEQGLERLAERRAAATLDTTQASLISDPFLQSTQECSGVAPTQTITTAAPWLKQDSPAPTPPKVVEVIDENAGDAVEKREATVAEKVHEDSIPESPLNAQANNENHSSDPLADDLLKRLNAGRLRVDL